MSVEDWARHEAERAFDGVHVFTAHGFQLGIVHAFSALLSDEAVEAAKLAGVRALGGAEQIEDASGEIWDIGDAIGDALQAAIAAVTEGESNG